MLCLTLMLFDHVIRLTVGRGSMCQGQWQISPVTTLMKLSSHVATSSSPSILISRHSRIASHGKHLVIIIIIYAFTTLN